MTREEALKFILENSREDYNNHSVVMPVEKATELKNKIFDYFEKERVCKNCKYYKKKIDMCGNMENGAMNGGSFMLVSEVFGCNRFERKEDERD
jgi:hypothetical protein